MGNIISVNNFRKSFGEKEVIKGISFDVKEGEIFAYLGINGSGKTTTIRTLLGIYQPDEGDLTIWGKRFGIEDSSQIGYLPEERGIYVNDKVLNVLIYFCQLKGVSYSTAKKRALDYLERVGLADKKDERLKKLSSGQQQKIQLGVCLIHQPQLLILDEPMKGFDPINRSLFVDIILEMKKQGVTILFSSHQMEDVEKMADSLLILKDGSLSAYGKLEEVKKGFGENTIKVWFEGEFNRNDNLFESIIHNNYAELTPKADEQHILKYLIENNMKITKFDISQPSLNDIFIKINK